MLSYLRFFQAPIKLLPYLIDLQEFQAKTQQDCFWIFTSVAQSFFC
jgi:hypothetical protein